MNFGQWVGAIVLLISLYFLWRIRQILLLLLVAVVLAMVLNRLVRKLQSVGVQRGVAIALTVVTFLITIIVFFGGVLPPLIEQLQKFLLLLPETLTEMQSWAEWLQTRIPGEWTEDLRILELLDQQLKPLVGHAFDNLLVWISDLLAIALKLVLILVLTVMLLATPQQYRQPFIRIFPAFYRSRIDDILTQCETDLVGWMTGTLIIMFVISVLSGLGLWILGVPLGLVCALWAGFCELIPNIGYIVAMLAPLAIALLDAPWKAIPVVLLYFLIQQLESYLIVPWVMRQRVALPPAITLLSQIVFATFFGFMGLFLALPLMIVTKILLREIIVKDIFDQWHQVPKFLCPREPLEQKNSKSEHPD